MGLSQLHGRFPVTNLWSLTQGSTNYISSVLYCSCVTSVYSLISSLKKIQPELKFIHLCIILVLCCSAHPLPPPCGLSDLPVNSCGCSELCLCYWKHPSKSAISHDVQMIGCAVFGYPFSFTGHDWRELPVMMMSFLCDAAKKKSQKKKKKSMELRQKL